MECPRIPVTTYTEFSSRIHDKTAGQRIPISGSIEVTARCNLRCVHCYINLPAGDIDAKQKELTYKQICDILDQIADEGCLWLLFTGGEPFIRPDFLDIYTYAKNKGFLITLFTNGTTITPHIADYLSEWRPFSIEITLYGITKETYERVTGVQGSYEHCMRGIELILDRTIPLKLKSMIMTLNKDEIWDMRNYAESSGVDFRYDPLLNLRLDYDQRPAEFRISPEEIVDIDLSDKKQMKKLRSFIDKFLGPVNNSEYLYQCGAGVRTFHIDANGQLSVCMLSRVPSFDLRNGRFRDGWYEFVPNVLTQKWLRESPCKKCDLISFCGQCPGWALVEHADQERPVEYLCQIAHARAEALGLASLKKGGKR